MVGGLTPEATEVRAKCLCTLVSDLCGVCLVFLPLVSIFGLFPVLVSCHYELILFQVCVCDCVNYPVYLKGWLIAISLF